MKPYRKMLLIMAFLVVIAASLVLGARVNYYLTPPTGGYVPWESNSQIYYLDSGYVARQDGSYVYIYNSVTKKDVQIYALPGRGESRIYAYLNPDLSSDKQIEIYQPWPPKMGGKYWVRLP